MDYTLWILTSTGQHQVVRRQELESTMLAMDVAVRRRQAQGWTVKTRNAKRVVMTQDDQMVAYEIAQEGMV